jgi:hypothetical protein
MLVLPFLLAALVSGSPEHIFKAPKPDYKVLNHSLVREIDQLRQDWGIKGASVAVVQLKDGVREQDTLGFGVADEAGNPVTEHVSFYFLSPGPDLGPDIRKDPLRYRLEFEIIHSHRSGPDCCKRNLGIHLENQNQGYRARLGTHGPHCIERYRLD